MPTNLITANTSVSSVATIMANKILATMTFFSEKTESLLNILKTHAGCQWALTDNPTLAYYYTPNIIWHLENISSMVQQQPNYTKSTPVVKPVIEQDVTEKKKKKRKIDN